MEGPCTKCSFPLDEENFDEYDEGDYTLMFASFNGHVECVKAWIQAGADVNVVNSYGQTPLYHTAKMGHVDCASALLQAGADVNITSKRNRTPLLAAAAKGSETLVKMFLEAGVDPDIADERGDVALHWTAHHGLCKATELLIKTGASVNEIENDNGCTPLMIAAVFGHEECVTLFLKTGAFINKKNHALNNALNMHLDICRPPNENVVMLLYSAGEELEDIALCSFDIPDILKHKELKTQLKHMCRQAIRKHLIKLNPHAHLFNRIPELGLPSSLLAYLQYYMSLDL